MLAAFLAGLAVAVLFVGLLRLTGLLSDSGAAAMSIIAVTSLYPAYAIGSGLPEVFIHLGILAAYAIVTVIGYLFAPRLIAVAVLAHAVLDLVVLIVLGSEAPHWVAFCGGFDLLLGGVFWRTLGARA